MAARDRYHDWVKTTLIQAGWTISHDPLSLRIGKIGIQIALGGCHHQKLVKQLPIDQPVGE